MAEKINELQIKGTKYDLSVKDNSITLQQLAPEVQSKIVPIEIIDLRTA